MEFDRSGNTIFRVRFTANEKKAFDAEIKRGMAEYARAHQLEMEAAFIRHVRRFTGWGETRLKRFYMDFSPTMKELIDYYEMADSDAPWLCTEELKREGFDIEAWHREAYPNEKIVVK